MIFNAHNATKSFAAHALMPALALAVLLPIASASHADHRQQATAAQTSETVPTPSKPRLRLRIAVDQFKWGEIRQEYYNLPRDVREGIQALLVDKLRASGCFQVMERETTAIQAGQVEGRIDQEKRAGLADPSIIALPARQKLTPARYIITPTVTGFQVTSAGKDGFHFGPFSTGNKKTEITLSVNIRISDAETGAVLESSTAEAKQENREKRTSIDLGGIGYGTNQGKQTSFSKVVETTLEKAVAAVVNRLGHEPWSALVAAQDGSTGRLILNAGTDAGLEMGMEFDVFKTGIVIRDPATLDVLSQGDETKIGRIRVVRLERGVAYCDVLDGKGFEARNVVRPAR